MYRFEPEKRESNISGTQYYNSTNSGGRASTLLDIFLKYLLKLYLRVFIQRFSTSCRFMSDVRSLQKSQA